MRGGDCMTKKIIAFLVIISLLFLIGCTNIPPSDLKDTISNQVTSKDADVKKEVVSKGVEKISETKPKEKPIIVEPLPKDIINLLEKTLITFADMSYKSGNLIDNYSSKEVSKEELCNQLKADKKTFNELLQDLNELTLSDKLGALKPNFEDLKKEVLGYGNKIYSHFDNALNYCSDGSIIDLSDAETDFFTFSYDYSHYYDGKAKSPSNPFGGSSWENYMEIIANKFEELKKITPVNFPTITEQKNQGIGDSIEKYGIKVTLNDVKKNYVDIMESYREGDWSNEEWKEIDKYQRTWINTYDNNFKKEMVDELNQKYASKVPIYKQYQFFDYTYELIEKEKLKGMESPDAILFIPSKGYTYDEVFGWSNYYVKGLYYLYPNERNDNVKFVVSFDGCGNNKEEIEAAEKGEICPLTFVFNIDLSKLKSEW